MYAHVFLIAMGIINFFHYTLNSRIEDFIRWVGMGFLYDFIIPFFPYLMAACIVGALSEWVKNWKILAVIGVISIVFITWAF